MDIFIGCFFLWKKKKKCYIINIVLLKIFMTVNYETILVNSMFALVVNISYKCGRRLYIQAKI